MSSPDTAAELSASDKKAYSVQHIKDVAKELAKKYGYKTVIIEAIGPNGEVGKTDNHD